MKVFIFLVLGWDSELPRINGAFEPSFNIRPHDTSIFFEDFK